MGDVCQNKGEYMNQQEKTHKACLKAKNRGEIDIKWFKNNKLTKESLKDFRKVMALADIDWEKKHDSLRIY